MKLTLPSHPQSVPLKMVGGNNYGRYKKISVEKTYNMIASDSGLVPYPGYRMVASINPGSRGRHIYYSSSWGNGITVIGNAVYGLSSPVGNSDSLIYFFIGNIQTFVGDVFIDENVAGQIAICDKKDIWIYNWKNPTSPALTAVNLPVDQATNAPIVPGYITYQNGYFITGNMESANWFLSAQNQGTNWNWSSGNPVFSSIQTKPTNFIAALRAPGRGNLLYLFGADVTELWTDVGAALFPYQRSTSVSIDYGCLNPNTIAAMDKFVAWLGVNERSGPVIMISSGSDITKISDDGIDYQLSKLKNPSSSSGFFFKEAGHLFYQITFTDPDDNFSLVYDFNRREFYFASDENMNYHIADSVAFMNNNYYFASLNDGNIYRISSEITYYDYTIPDDEQKVRYEIPRVRVCPPIRMQDSTRFVINDLSFTMEQGNDPFFKSDYLTGDETVLPYVPRVDLSMSTDGGETFSSYISQKLYPQGKRANRVVFYQLGMANDVTFQFRFWGWSKFVVFDGVVSIY